MGEHESTSQDKQTGCTRWFIDLVDKYITPHTIDQEGGWFKASRLWLIADFHDVADWDTLLEDDDDDEDESQYFPPVLPPTVVRKSSPLLS